MRIKSSRRKRITNCGKATEKAGILSEIRKREHYEKPSVKKKKKAV